MLTVIKGDTITKIRGREMYCDFNDIPYATEVGASRSAARILAGWPSFADVSSPWPVLQGQGPYVTCGQGVKRRGHGKAVGDHDGTACRVIAARPGLLLQKPET